MKVIAQVEPDSRRFQVVGQTARCLIALVEAGERGVIALDVSSWALRLAAYCFELKKNHALQIETIREPHPGGWHGRHILRTPVRIVSVETREAAHV